MAGRSLQSPLDARPTVAHRVLAALQRRELIKLWVQQNHDSLGQKAGFPNALVNSIHGDWYDPSNPVVQFSGSLRTDLFEQMCEWETSTDLSLVLGTSLSGMNADRMAERPARHCDLPKAHYSRPLSLKELRSASCLGTVIVNLQRTRLDARASLRIWAKLDTVFELLAHKLDIPAAELAMPPLVLPLPVTGDEDVFLLPRYSPTTGLKLADEAPDSRFVLDLRDGARVRIAHPDASNLNALGVVDGQTPEGHWKIAIKRPGKLTRVYVLGRWWIAEAMTGVGHNVPVVSAQVE